MKNWLSHSAGERWQTLAEDIAPFGLASRVLPVDYQTIAEPVHRVLDSLISGHLSNGVVDTAVDEISQTSKNRKKRLKTFILKD